MLKNQFFNYSILTFLVYSFIYCCSYFKKIIYCLFSAILQNCHQPAGTQTISMEHRKYIVSANKSIECIQHSYIL